MNRIQTERLTLSSLKPGDATFLHELMNTPSWLKYIGDRNVHSVKEARTYLRQGPLQHVLDHGFGMRKMILTASKTPIGISGLVRREGLPLPDLGFALLPEYEGNGFAFEASRSVLTEDTRPWDMHEVSAITTADNLRSIALLHRLGFFQNGDIRLPGQEELLHYFTLDLKT